MSLVNDLKAVLERRDGGEWDHLTPESRELLLLDSVRAALIDHDDRTRAAIPTEPLYATREYQAIGRARDHLDKSFALFCAKNAGSFTAGNMTGLRRWCWEQARHFFADFDRPTPTPPTTPAATAPEPPARLSDDQYTLLLWLADYQPAPTSAYPVELGPDASAAARRDLIKLGLIRACPWEDTYGWELSEAGAKRAGVAPRAAGAA